MKYPKSHELSAEAHFTSLPPNLTAYVAHGLHHSNSAFPPSSSFSPAPPALSPSPSLHLVPSLPPLLFFRPPPFPSHHRPSLHGLLPLRLLPPLRPPPRRLWPFHLPRRGTPWPRRLRPLRPFRPHHRLQLSHHLRLCLLPWLACSQAPPWSVFRRWKTGAKERQRGGT